VIASFSEPKLPSRIDTAESLSYLGEVKNQSNRRTAATPGDIVRLAKNTKWGDLALPTGETVAAETVREMFAYAEAGLKRGKRRKSRHAAAA
jgi:hypothetical protein